MAQGLTLLRRLCGLKVTNCLFMGNCTPWLGTSSNEPERRPQIKWGAEQVSLCKLGSLKEASYEILSWAVRNVDLGLRRRDFQENQGELVGPAAGSRHGVLGLSWVSVLRGGSTAWAGACIPPTSRW